MELSIIIPVYNAEKYLKQCLDSVTACPIHEIEILLVDDGSKDQSSEICDRYAGQDSRIRVFHRENKGVSAARNYGMEQASGKWLMFLDADDCLKTEQWSHILACTSKKYDFIGFAYESFAEDGFSQKELFPFKGRTCRDESEIQKILIGTPLLHTCWGKLFRRELVERYTCRFREGVKIGEDYIFVMDYLDHAVYSVLVNECILRYRQTEGSAMRSFHFALRFECMRSVWKRCDSYIKQRESSQMRNWFCQYQFRSYTKFFREIAGNASIQTARKQFQDVLNDSCFQETMQGLHTAEFPLYKKIEYLMIKRRQLRVMYLYFKLKFKMNASA